MTKKDPKTFENAVKSRVSGLSTILESNPPLTTYEPNKIKGFRISWTISCTIFKRTPVICSAAQTVRNAPHHHRGSYHITLRCDM